MHFDPTDPAYLANPYPTYTALRAAGTPTPVGSVLGDSWPIARFEDVSQVLRTPESFSSSAMLLPGQDGADAALLAQDPPAHTRQREIVSRGFTPRRIAQLEPRIQKCIDELMAPIAEKRGAELIRELAAPLPVRVIAELLGLDPARHEDFKRWSDNMVVGASTATPSEGQLERAVAEMRSHLDEVIEARRRDPAEDLISALIHAEEEQGALNAEQVLNFVQLLLAAGSETTTNLLGSATWILGTQPGVQDEVLGDPGLIPNLLEETLRWESPVQLVMRRTTREVELGGATLAPESFVFALIGSANRDDGRFENADRFDLHRETKGHLSFGLGAHFCLGAALARLQAKLALESMFSQLGRIEVATDPVETHGSFLVRGPKALEIRAAV